MTTKTIKVSYRIIAILLGICSTGFQIENFVFGTMVKSSLNKQSEWSYYTNEFIPHLFTIVICVWFIIYQIKSIMKYHNQNGKF